MVGLAQANSLLNCIKDDSDARARLTDGLEEKGGMKGDKKIKKTLSKCPQNNSTSSNKGKKRKEQTLPTLLLAMQMKCWSNLVYWHLFFIHLWVERNLGS